MYFIPEKFQLILVWALFIILCFYLLIKFNKNKYMEIILLHLIGGAALIIAYVFSKNIYNYMIIIFIVVDMITLIEILRDNYVKNPFTYAIYNLLIWASIYYVCKIIKLYMNIKIEPFLILPTILIWNFKDIIKQENEQIGLLYFFTNLIGLIIFAYI